MVVPAENQSATLLIVDDDAAARERLRDIFETAHYRVVTATEAASALRVLKGVRCDLVALDLEMPGVDGLQAASGTTVNKQVTNHRAVRQ
jgi:CheY-like chemotaxis protein